MGEVRKRGKKYWIRYYRNGRRIEESARTEKFESARDLLKTREGDVAKGVPLTAKIGRLRFDEAAEDLKTDYRINGKKSLTHVTRNVKQLSKTFGGRRMAEVSGSDIKRYIEARQQDGVANATINRELSALRRMFTLAVEAGKILGRPKIKLLHENAPRQGFFEPHQVASLLTHLSPPLQSLATFAYYSGWRRGEMLSLEWGRVDRKNSIVRLDVGSTKNGDGREFIYRDLPDVTAAIDQQWAAHKALEKAGKICPFVFVHEKGKYKGQRIAGYQKAWTTAREQAGCPGRTMHDFRRTTVRALERSGVSRSVSMKWTGHKTESVYRRYAIVSSGDLADAGRKLQMLTMGTIAGTIDASAGETESAKAAS